MKKTSTTPTWLARVESRVYQRLKNDVNAFSKAFIEEYDLNVRLADEATEQDRIDIYAVSWTARHYARAAAAAAYIAFECRHALDGSPSPTGDAFLALLCEEVRASEDARYIDDTCKSAVNVTALIHGLAVDASHYRWLALGWAAELAHMRETRAEWSSQGAY